MINVSVSRANSLLVETGASLWTSLVQYSFCPLFRRSRRGGRAFGGVFYPTHHLLQRKRSPQGARVLTRSTRRTLSRGRVGRLGTVVSKICWTEGSAEMVSTLDP